MFLHSDSVHSNFLWGKKSLWLSWTQLGNFLARTDSSVSVNYLANAQAVCTREGYKWTGRILLNWWNRRQDHDYGRVHISYGSNHRAGWHWNKKFGFHHYRQAGIQPTSEFFFFKSVSIYLDVAYKNTAVYINFWFIQSVAQLSNSTNWIYGDGAILPDFEIGVSLLMWKCMSLQWETFWERFEWNQ